MKTIIIIENGKISIEQNPMEIEKSEVGKEINTRVESVGVQLAETEMRLGVAIGEIDILKSQIASLSKPCASELNETNVTGDDTAPPHGDLPWDLASPREQILDILEDECASAKSFREKMPVDRAKYGILHVYTAEESTTPGKLVAVRVEGIGFVIEFRATDIKGETYWMSRLIEGESTDHVCERILPFFDALSIAF